MTKLVGSGILVACAVAAAAYVWIIPLLFNLSPVALEDLKKIQPGMNKQQVSKILGKPTHIFKEGEMWSYSGIGWAIAYVDFDQEGKVKNVRYDP